jgi:tetratricopeptide (TPR) repeat protein
MNQLIKYIKNPGCPDSNFDLGLYYESIRQYSAAGSFYLKCAELSPYVHQRYEALLRLHLCITELGGREATCEHIIKQAISLCPEYSIGYFFMTQICERKGDWSSVYFYASLGLKAQQNPIFVSSFDYQHYNLLFQKAAAAWWIGKPDESRSLYRYILDNYINILSESYTNLLENNLCSLGSGPQNLCMHSYPAKDLGTLKYPFPGVEKIVQNFSQVYQDMFVLTVLEGKHNGTYLEIGSGEPFYGSNTALLETVFGWKGVGIEYDSSRASKHSIRKNPVFCVDGTTVDYNKLLSEYFDDNIIDYLQLDIEPSRNTFMALQKIPFDKYQFKVITYEHDHYIDIKKQYRDKSREFLTSLGYVLLVNDISPRDDCSFEDWWVNPTLVSSSIMKNFDHLRHKRINLATNILF